MSNKHFAKFLMMAAVAVLLAVPSAALAQDASRGMWMASSSTETSLAGRDFGRLAMADGVLSFKSSNYEWRLDLSEVKRVSSSKAVSNALEIESVTGQVYYVGILNGQLTMTSPGKAVQAIQRAVKVAPAAPVPARTTMAAAGGGTQ